MRGEHADYHSFLQNSYPGLTFTYSTTPSWEIVVRGIDITQWCHCAEDIQDMMCTVCSDLCASQQYSGFVQHTLPLDDCCSCHDPITRNRQSQRRILYLRSLVDVFIIWFGVAICRSPSLLVLRSVKSGALLGSILDEVRCLVFICLGRPSSFSLTLRLTV